MHCTVTLTHNTAWKTLKASIQQPPNFLHYRTALHTCKTTSSSLKRSSNETVSLIIRFLEEEDTKFFQKLVHSEAMTNYVAESILTMTELTLQSSGHQQKHFILPSSGKREIHENNQVTNNL